MYKPLTRTHVSARALRVRYYHVQYIFRYHVGGRKTCNYTVTVQHHDDDDDGGALPVVV